MALAITTPPLLPKACKKRYSHMTSMFFTNTTARDESIKIDRHSMIGFLLPYLSDIGPQKSCPIANPPKNVESDI